MKKLSIALLIAGFAFSGCSKKDAILETEQSAAAPLSAAFTIDHQDEVKEGLPAQLRNASVSAVSYNWDFGTGDFSTAKDPVYSFPGCGPRNVTLMATDAAGNMKSYSVQLEVLCGGKHPQTVH